MKERGKIKIRAKVSEIVAEIAGINVQDIKMNSPISKLGIDSLMALSAVARIEKHFKVSIPEKRLREIKSIESIVNLVEGSLTTK